MIDEAADLDEVENDWDSDVEEEYVHRRWELLSKAEMYAEEVKKVLENKKKSCRQRNAWEQCSGENKRAIRFAGDFRQKDRYSGRLQKRY